jgi:hypothetical protein
VWTGTETFLAVILAVKKKQNKLNINASFLEAGDKRYIAL